MIWITLYYIPIFSFDLFSFLDRPSCIIVAGGYSGETGVFTAEVLLGGQGTVELLNLPKTIYDSSMVMHNGDILLTGGYGNMLKCLKLTEDSWKEHSALNYPRPFHSAVTTKSATFLFGGTKWYNHYEYLPKGSSKWLYGKTFIPGGLLNGCAIAVKDEQEIWLIGGSGTKKRILRFNVNDHTFLDLPFQLKVGRSGHRCAFIPNTNKIMITGGKSDGNCLDATEILDTEDGSVTMASPMNFKRVYHGMGVVTIYGKERLAVFGGFNGRYSLDTVEFYNHKTAKWEMAGYNLNEPKQGFGFLEVKLGDIISKFQ